MKIAIIYVSKTKNTEIIAKAIYEQLKDKDIVYFGSPKQETIEADLYIIGSWTDKGNADSKILDSIQKLKNKKIAYFGTAGYGKDEKYYETLFSRVKEHIDDSNQILGYFFCQGKMPLQVKDRYVQMMREHPDDARLKVSIENFDEALDHPNDDDRNHAKEWISLIVNKI